LQGVTTVDWFLAGQSAIQLGYYIYDRESQKRLDAAVANEKTESAKSKQFQNDLTCVMLAMYLNVQRLQKKLEDIEENIHRSQKIVKIAGARKGAGLGTKIDRMRAQGLLEIDRMKKLDAQVQRDKAIRDLATILGESKLFTLPGPLSYHEFSLTALLKDASEESVLKNRPDMMATRDTVNAADQLRLSAQRQRFPCWQMSVYFRVRASSAQMEY